MDKESYQEKIHILDKEVKTKEALIVTGKSKKKRQDKYSFEISQKKL